MTTYLTATKVAAIDPFGIWVDVITDDGDHTRAWVAAMDPAFIPMMDALADDLPFRFPYELRVDGDRTAR